MIAPRKRGLPFGLLFAAVVGCGGPPPPPDPAVIEPQARARLTAALEGWVGGTPPREFEKQNPGVYFSGGSMSAVPSGLPEGAKLARFNIGPGTATSPGTGNALEFEYPVKLTVQSSAGAATERAATYSVGYTFDSTWSVRPAN